jgi:hypothetical protein
MRRYETKILTRLSIVLKLPSIAEADHLDQFLLHHSNALLARYESSTNDTDLNLSLTQIEEGIKIHRTKRNSSGAEIAPW